MAEAALLGVAKSVLGQLSSPALKEVLLLWNFDKDLKRFDQTIQTITDFLHDAEQRESKERLVKGWLSRLRAILYDADDLFDGVAAMALCKKAMSGNAFKREVTLFFSKSNQLAFMVKTAHHIKNIRDRLNDIQEDMLPFQFQCRKIEEIALDREETHSFVDVKTVIGRDVEKEDIISFLLSDETCQKNLSVISVIGFGGLGKTTLAQLVYNDDRVQTGFDLRIWTCINYLSDLKSVLVTILTSVLESKPQYLDLDQLQGKLRENIGGKKFLLVLDDVWDESASNWGKLETLLSCCKSGSRVLATTRKTEVAKCLDAKEPYYCLHVLSKESAWSLFVKMAFKDGEFSSDSELVPLGQQIVRKCGYVPLALITIGRMLRSKKKEKKLWLSIVDKELPEALLDDNGNDNVMQVLKVSYNDLPPALKHCFAYCSLFPKDYIFDKDELVHMWIAQGFIEPHSKKSWEEVGDECFFHMVNRCFFQEVEEDTKGGCIRYTCKMHDLLHDLAIQVAGTERRCFIEEKFEGMDGGSTLRHISVYCNPNFLIGKFAFSYHSKKLRTLMLDSARQLEISSLKSFLECFKMLRVLRLPNLDVSMLPDSFGGLAHLRYLDLSYNENLKKIPDSISKLHHLETLNLKWCSSLVELPSNLRKLGSLRHLFLRGCKSLDSLSSGLAEITTLVTLDRIFVHHLNGGLRYLGRLNDLCGRVKFELPLKGWSNCIEDARKSNMFKKHKLNGMIIGWMEDGERETTKEETQAVLEALRPHENLEYLKIEGYVGDKLPSWVFSLSNLKQLILKNCTNLEYLYHEKVTFESVFPCLEILEMECLLNLKGWWREVATPEDNARMSVLPSLSRVSKVSIGNCGNLVESMPSIVGIEYLKLHEVNEKLLSSLFSPPSMCCSSNCHPYSKLKKISLWNVEELSCLPEGLMKCFSAVRSLTVECCEGLRWVSRCGLAYLTALEKLQILDCGSVNLEDEDDDEKEEEINNGLVGMPWRALQRLRHLDVPWQRHLQGGIQYLTALEELRIHYYERRQVEADNEEVQVRGMLWKGHDKLHTLVIEYSNIREEPSTVIQFPKWIQYLRFVKKLTFDDCKELSVSWTILANMKLLQELIFNGVSMVVDETATEQQSKSNSLLRLLITNASWMHDIPWKLFSSLRTLVLNNIDSLERIPDGFQHLVSLQELTIEGCPEELGKRCDPKRGEDWRLISHIPAILISWTDDVGDWWKIEMGSAPYTPPAGFPFSRHRQHRHVPGSKDSRSGAVG